MYGYIYKTTNLINGKIYIGQHKGKMSSHYIGSGNLMKLAIAKHGKENFSMDIIAFATTKAMLDGLEMKHIYEYRQVFGEAFMYNLAIGGGGANGYKHTEDAKRRISIAHKKKPVKHWLGKHHSEETKKKMSIAHSGENNHMFGKGFKGIDHQMYGKQHSLESREKMRISRNNFINKQKEFLLKGK